MSSLNLRTSSELISDFNITVSKILTYLEGKSRDEFEVANLDRLRKRIQLLKSTTGTSVLIMYAAPFFEEYSDQIIDRDEDGEITTRLFAKEQSYKSMLKTLGY